MDLSANFNQFINGLSTFLIGVTVVFVTLVLLILFINVMSKVISSIEQTGKKEQEPVSPQPVEVPVAATSAVQQTDELELIAVITAVIAASMGTTSDKLQVKSFRKVERKTR